MLAAAAEAIPRGDGWVYAPKWDGFRAGVFRDGDAVHLCSRSGQPLERSFAEAVTALRHAATRTTAQLEPPPPFSLQRLVAMARGA